MKVSMNDNHFIASKVGDGPNNYQYIYRYDSDQVDDDERLPILRTTSKVIHREEAFLPGKATLPHHVYSCVFHNVMRFPTTYLVRL